MLEIILLAAQLSTATISYEEALTLAEKNEASLSQEMNTKLVQIQGDALHLAMDNCAKQDSDLSKFTIVLSLNSNGSVNNSWRQGETALANCVQRQLETTGLKGEWSTPFYTFIEVSFEK